VVENKIQARINWFFMQVALEILLSVYVKEQVKLTFLVLLRVEIFSSKPLLLICLFFIIFFFVCLQIIGLNNVPIAGDEFEIVDSLETAREKAESRTESLRNDRISAKAGDGKVTLSSLASAVSVGKLSGLDLHQLNIVMKVDLQV
jgi:hypothetical protein